MSISGSDDRVQQALAAYLRRHELGGPAPDVSHLTPSERERLQSLIDLLSETEGVGFGRGLGSGPDEAAPVTDAGRALVAALREGLSGDVRIADDPAAAAIAIPGMRVSEGWIVGSFGGRVRVWLLASDGGLRRSVDWLRGLDRVFRSFTDTVAVALVEPDLSCLLVLPEDCAPAIEVPVGSVVPRRYRRPVQPVVEALSGFLGELILRWEPLAVEQGADVGVDVAALAGERATRAVEEQIAAGARARKTNPKRKALTELDPEAAERLARLVLDVHEGRTPADDVDATLRRLAAEA